ncbi:MAG: leucine-rich repeat protein [Bacillota bacterium]
MKRNTIKALLLLGFVAALMFAMSLGAGAAVVDSGSCGYRVNWTLDDAGTLTISGTGIMEDYKEGCEHPPWYGNKSIKKAVIEPGVGTIGECAFDGCANLTSVSIPDSVLSIGGWAFSDCSSLQNIAIPDSVVSVGRIAFGGCTSLRNIKLSDSMTEISGWMFKDCALASVTIPKSVTEIQDMAFDGCVNLTSVTISDSVTRIGFWAFGHCDSLTSVTIPKSVVDIGNCPFASCASLREIVVDKGNPAYSSDGNGVLYNKDQTCLIQYPAGKEGDCVIPDGVTSIADRAFNGCYSLTSVTIPVSVVEIDSWAFFPDVYVPLRGWEGSAAQTFAEEQGVSFIGFHKLVKTEAKAASPAAAGNITYFTCSVCGRIFLDDQGKTEITKADTVIPALDSDGAKQAFAVADVIAALPEAKNVKKADAAAIRTARTSFDALSLGQKALVANEDKLKAAEKALAELPEEPSFRFVDVTDEGKFYYTPVYWAVDHDPQITNGLDATHFGPEQTCTRGQVVTFLWRAKGCPEPVSAKNPFKDVKTTDYFYKAVLWAVENGITNGTSETTFSPKDPCTRAQVAAFLYRTEGSPAAAAKNPFTDVKSGKYYYNAVLWAVAKNITAGTSAMTFAPDAPCTRGHIVTFLYRDLAN